MTRPASVFAVQPPVGGLIHALRLRARSTHFAPVTAAPAASQPARVGLIEQSTRAQGNEFSARSMSTRPAGPTPAGVSTQGEI